MLGFTAIAMLLDRGVHQLPKVAVPVTADGSAAPQGMPTPDAKSPKKTPKPADKPAGDTKPESGKKPGKPGDNDQALPAPGGKPGAEKPGTNKPGAGKPGAGKPGEGSPGAGKPAPVKNKPVQDRVDRNCTGAGKAGPSGRPGLSNPGVLKASGKVVVTQAGAVIENLDINGYIDIRADNVTVRNVRIKTNSRHGITVKRGVAGTKIRHVDISMGGPGKTIDAGIGGVGDHDGRKGQRIGSNMTVENSYIHGNGDGIKIANYSLYRGNKIFAAKHSGSPLHVDGMQASGRYNFTVTHNDIAVHAGSANAPLFIQSWTAKRNRDVYGVYVACNVLDGGVYSFHTEDGKNTNQSFFKDITVENNRFTARNKYGKYHLDGPVKGNIGS